MKILCKIFTSCQHKIDYNNNDDDDDDNNNNNNNNPPRPGNTGLMSSGG